MSVPNQKITYQKVQQSIVNLKKGNVADVSSIVLYVLNPQLASFQYDVYDFNKTNVDFTTGMIRITVQDDIKMLISLNDIIQSNEIFSVEDDFKIYVYFDYDNLTYDLYFKVLGNWEIVEHVDFKLSPSDDEKEQKAKIERESKSFMRLSNYITSNTITNSYKSKKEKYFTEAVLDRYLENKEFNNEFIRTALMNEFKNPSKELITMVASALGKEFTTMPLEQVEERLQPLTGKGLYSAVESLVVGDAPMSTPQTFNREDYDYLKTTTKTSDIKETKEVDKEDVKEDVKSEVKTEVKENVKEDVKKEVNQENKQEKVVEKQTKEKLVGKDKLQDLGMDLTKKPVNDAKINKEKLNDNGAISLDDLFTK